MKTINLLIVLLIGTALFGQDRYYTKSGKIEFYSHSPLEDITAINNQVAAFLDIPTGKLTFAVLIKSFEFEKALMQEHFNENYLESDDFPKSKYQGQIIDYKPFDLSVNGEHKVKTTGKLTMHGVTQEVNSEATLKIENGKIAAKATFKIEPEQYKIRIPKAVRDNIAKEIEVRVDVLLNAYTK